MTASSHARPHQAICRLRRRTYLRYRIDYTRDVSAVQPVHVSIATAPDCATFYEVLRNDEQPAHLVHYRFKLPVDINLVFAQGHQHAGAINISMSVNGVRQCTSYPRYGTQKDVAGNELGYLVQMSQCVNSSTGAMLLKTGDTVSIDSYYNVASHDPRLAYSDGTHLNVMSYMYMIYTRGGSSGPSGALETSQVPLLRAPGTAVGESLNLIWLSTGCRWSSPSCAARVCGSACRSRNSRSSSVRQSEVSSLTSRKAETRESCDSRSVGCCACPRALGGFLGALPLARAPMGARERWEASRALCLWLERRWAVGLDVRCPAVPDSCI